MMDIKKIRLADTTNIEYENDNGLFKIKSNEAQHPDFTKAVRALRPLFVFRMAMAPVKSHVMVDGLDCGSDDEGDWYRVSGIYTAHTQKYKLLCAKVRPAKDEEFWKDKEPKAYPAILTKEELEAVLKVVEEAESFINLNKRCQLELKPVDEVQVEEEDDGPEEDEADEVFDTDGSTEAVDKALKKFEQEEAGELFKQPRKAGA
jgi:hypothetical protein